MISSSLSELEEGLTTDVVAENIISDSEPAKYDEHLENNRNEIVQSSSCNCSSICSPLNLNLPPIFILNLDRAKDRWQKTLAEFKAAGFSESQINRIPAVDGRKLSNADLAANSTRLARFLQPRGVLGCYLSHRTFWQLTVDRGYPSALIFEDDIQLVKGFLSKLTSSLGHLCEEMRCGGGPVDVALLGALGRVHPQGKDSLGAVFFAEYMGGSRPLKKLTHNIYQPVRAAGTHGYLVTREGAQKLLRLCNKAVFHIDLDAWRHKSLKIVMFDPVLVYQTFDSTSLTDLPSSSTGTPPTNNHAVQAVKMPWSLLHYDSGSPLHCDGSDGVVSSFPRSLNWLTADPHTLQPFQHVMDEPLIQLGPRGPILTVGRHVKIVGALVVLASFLSAAGQKYLSRMLFGSAVSFVISVRSIIWLLLNWK